MRKLKEIDLIEMIGEVDRKSKQWATQILYFSSQWFKELERQLADPECSAPAMELASYFNNTGWASLARVRYNDDQLTDALTELGGDSNAARCKAAYLLLRHSLQVLSQRRPCFALANDHADLGPLDTFRQELLQVARLDPTILVPTYLQAGQAGFLSLSQLVPSAFEESPEDSLEDVFKIILRARNAAMKHRVAVPGLDNLPVLFSRLAFRVKSGRLRQKGRHGSILTQDPLLVARQRRLPAREHSDRAVLRPVLFGRRPADLGQPDLSRGRQARPAGANGHNCVVNATHGRNRSAHYSKLEPVLN